MAFISSENFGHIRQALIVLFFHAGPLLDTGGKMDRHYGNFISKWKLFHSPHLRFTSQYPPFTTEIVPKSNYLIASFLLKLSSDILLTRREPLKEKTSILLMLHFNYAKTLGSIEEGIKWCMKLLKILVTFRESFPDEKLPFFAIARLSLSAGFVDWKGLLPPLAKEPNLDVDKEHDLVTVAQYHVNLQSNNRADLTDLILNSYARKQATVTESHEILARLPFPHIGQPTTTSASKTVAKGGQHSLT